MRVLKLPLTGGCQCGAIRYEVSEFPKTLYCCHCTECQAQSASAFGISLRVSGSAIEFSDEPSKFVRDHGKSTEVECLFCPDCGTRLVHRRNASDVNASIKAGSLDEALDPVGHIWVKSKQNWIVLPEDSLQYETQPKDGYTTLIEAFAKKYE